MSSKGVIPYTSNATRISAYGHQDWRIPTLAELNVLFNNRAAIGGFNLSGSKFVPHAARTSAFKLRADHAPSDVTDRSRHWPGVDFGPNHSRAEMFL